MIGLIGKKIGMTQVFDDDGTVVPVTVIQVEPNVVVGQRTVERDGYDAVVVGAFDAKDKRVTKPVRGQYPEGVAPKRCVREFRGFELECSVGDSLTVNAFENTAFVDVSGITKGKGYQGVMRRHGFAGGRKTHGSKFKRGLGATGMAATPSRIQKGTKMPGRMGGERATVQNLRVLRVDSERNALLVSGAVPGRRDGYVEIRSAVKK